MDDLERAREVWKDLKKAEQITRTENEYRKQYHQAAEMMRVEIAIIATYGKQERERALEEAAQRMMDWEGDWNAAKLAYAIRALKERKP